ncbi:unnamed protein product [Sphagnum jensenii]|uniref:Uncharacterized protein n=1 Tax=Sphagnum jensenii TaxID=128206 RepID=A0ABP1ACW6_9BRYO
MMALMLMVLSLKEASLMPWFCSKFPDTLASDVAAPPLCAGVTVYSPMMCHHINQAGAGRIYFIVDTASVMYPLDPYLSLLKQEGRITIVSAPPEMKFTPVLLLTGLKTISGSMIGGMKEDLQEIILFANLLKPPLSRHKFTRAIPFSHHCGGTFLIKNLTHKPFYCCCWRCS